VKINRLIVAVVVVTGLLGRVQPTRGQATAPATAPASGDAAAVAPFINELTFLVVRADLGRVDLKAFLSWFADVLRSNTHDPEVGARLAEEVQRNMGEADKLFADLRAAGAREMVWLMGTDDLRTGPVALVPVPAGADPAAIAEALSRMSNGSLKTAHVNGAVVYGDQRVVNKAKGAKAADRADLAGAFAAAGDAPVRAAFVPTPALRTVFTTAMPALPQSMGGGPTFPLAQGLEWAAVQAGLPPGSPVRVIAQAKDAAAAQKLAETLTRWIDTHSYRTDVSIKDDGILTSVNVGLTDDPNQQVKTPAAEAVRALLRPKLADTTLVIDVPAADVDAKIAAPLAASTVVVQSGVARGTSIANVRSIMQACVRYVNDNKGATPDKLDDVRKYLGDGGPSADWTLTNPRDRNRKPGYVYLKPLTDFAHAGKDHVVVYEAHDAFPAGGIAVGFADGHAEFIADEAKFKRLLAATEEDNMGGGM